jgi:DNA-binding transcriptional MocR family regulator
MLSILSVDCDLSSRARLTAAGLFVFLGRDGSGANPSQRTLVKVTGLARSTVQLALAELESEGYVIRREFGWGRRGFPNHAYEATMPTRPNGPISGPIEDGANGPTSGPIVGRVNGPTAGHARMAQRTDSSPSKDPFTNGKGPAGGPDPSLNRSMKPSERAGASECAPRTETRETAPPEVRERLRRAAGCRLKAKT